MKASARKKKLVITAGPTREPIDPVRFISNYSTGTLGYVLAEMARRKGYDVTLISGPTELPCPKGVTRISVETASQMQQAVSKAFPGAEALVMSAAVADFRPVRVASQKIKRSGAVGSLRLWQLEMMENPDIVAAAASRKHPGQAVVGFALETQHLLANARRKMRSKNLDAIVATSYVPGAKEQGPFGGQPVDGALLDRKGRVQQFRSLPKKQLAARILNTLARILKERACLSC